MKMKIHKLQIARRLVQIAVVLLLLALPVNARYANYVAANEIDRHLERWEGSLQGNVLTLFDRAYRALPGGEKERVGEMVRDDEGVLHNTQAFRGGPWSAEIAHVSMSDPLAAVESMVARKHVAKVVVISLIVPLIATLLLGRVFCSWICPVGFLLELTDKLRGAVAFLEIHPRNVRFSRGTKYALLGGGLATAALFSVPVLGYIYPPAIASREAHDFVFGVFDRAEAGQFGLWFGGLTWMSLIIAAIALFEVVLSRRWWCRYVCPGGGLYSLLGATRPIRVKLLEPKCTHCGDCVVACPMGLNPMLDRMGVECDSCGACISSCDDKALAYGLWRTRKRATEEVTPSGTLIAK